MLWGALNHLWQSTLVAAVIIMAVPLFRRQAARTRFWLWFAASAQFLLPFALLTALGTQLAAHFRPATLPATISGFLDAPAARVTAASLAPLSAAPPPVTMTQGFDWSVLIAAIWLAGTLAFTLRWIIDALAVRAMVRAATPSSICAPLPVRITTAPMQPALAGLLHPCILLPQNALAELSPAERDAVLAHELAHWRRRDHLWSLVHRLVEVLFWFHPLVWWLGARLNTERERACDEAVLQSGIAAPDYAASLVRVCSLHLRATPLAGAQMSAANLKARIGTILGQAAPAPCGAGRRLGIAAALLVCLGVPFATGFAKPSVQAANVSDQSHPASEVVLHWLIPQLGGPAAPVMTKDMARKFDTAKFLTARYLKQWGPLISLTFLTTDTDGYDFYETRFERGHAFWRIGLAKDGKTLTALNFFVSTPRNSTAHPQAGTEDMLRAYIASLEAGKPNYQQMSPELAATVYYQLPAVMKQLNALGRFESLTFLDRNANGMDAYRAQFAHGFAEWHIAPPNRDGKRWAGNFWSVPAASTIVRQ